MRSAVAGLRIERALAEDFRPAIPAQPTAHRFAPQYVALDLGTNNCRLLVARPAGTGFRVVDAFSRIVRLGEGLAVSGALSEDAMARTLHALKICAGKIAARTVAAGRYVATEACRRAANCDEFLARVREEVGLDIEIISSTEEARLVVTGCAPLLNPRIPYAVVFDIGGGSTEIVWLRLWAGRSARAIRAHALHFASHPNWQGADAGELRHGNDPRRYSLGVAAIYPRAG
jgi:exopolyphosphatase/guanosine-5'-triphosphate,3'-diphosphate pyrophosphatase